jgi:uncharacterized protein (DUF885 family)
MTLAPDPLSGIAGRYVERFAILDPCLASMMGVSGDDGALTDYSPDGFAARRDLAARTLAEIPDQPGAAAAMLRQRLEADLALADAGLLQADLGGVDGPLPRLRQAIELLDRGPDTPWDDLHARLHALPGALAGLRATLTRSGKVAAHRQVLISADLAHRFAAYLQRLGCDQDTTARAAQALADFATFLTTELAPRAPQRDGVGAEHYQLAVRGLLGTHLDLIDTYDWGWAELGRIRDEMHTAAAQIAPGEPLKAVFAALDADPAHQITGADAFRAHLQNLADQAIDDLDGVHFDIPDALRRIDCHLTDTGGVYYLAPTENLSRPGQMWWTPSDTPYITWTVPATIYHEGVPGHHLQLGGTVVAGEGLNRFQRVASELYPGHSEGWGLYAERLMDELGYYQNPAHRLGMLAGGQQFRAARVILDIGLHLELPIPPGAGFHEGERWTRELAVEFLRLHTGPESEASLAFEADRYLGLPGQAIAYKLGERVWLAGRDAAAARPGFDLKDFHRRALALGPMGLDLLAAELAKL